MSQKAYQLVDGLGVERVTNVMFETPLKQNKQFRINILSDKETWLCSAIETLKVNWLQLGHEVNWVFLPSDLKEGDVCFILGCSKIVLQTQLALNNHNLVVHESALPEGRGWSPMTWQILEGKTPYLCHII